MDRHSSSTAQRPRNSRITVAEQAATSSSAPSGTQKVIYAAILANAGIAISKFIAAAVTGSASMVAEGIHSAVDTGNELLLLIGLRRSMQRPDSAHPFGYGKAQYVWAMIVALSIFTLGGGVSIYHGILSLRDPHPIENPFWSYLVLIVAAAFEGYSWLVSRKELAQRRRDGENLWQTVRRSQDPAVFTVFIEDSAALVGIAIALAGIGLGQLLDNPYIDPSASILIGLVLICAAIILAREIGGLIIGESLDKETLDQVRQTVLREPDVELVGRLLSMQLGSEQVLLVAEVSFKRGMRVEELDQAISRLQHAVSSSFPVITKVFFDALER
ncbi:cation diffusion facilitator family transporter [Noviherbaspirillum malthae]|uniref:cation diffusion facilitator family transporter n=1 Tax=Noviherbaspirillum malthae TaxID=1260987 RepID=UPI00188DE2A1|nr:cation diffusion facilitator family transporter [Noviherbaspirillum malthae]